MNKTAKSKSQGRFFLRGIAFRSVVIVDILLKHWKEANERFNLVSHWKTLKTRLD
ncbi:MAG: hypothetical protein ACXAEL_14600 [Candidatus Hodarchaeales archaeon]